MSADISYVSVGKLAASGREWTGGGWLHSDQYHHMLNKFPFFRLTAWHPSQQSNAVPEW